jgi:hypothetical protein
MTTATAKMEAARATLETSTENVLILARRNEFIGKPVTTLEERIRKQRDRLIRAELKKARQALDALEKGAVNA